MSGLVGRDLISIADLAREEVDRLFATTDRLKGEVAIVTGSTSGLGKEIARMFGAEGAQVVVTGRSAERGLPVMKEISANPDAARPAHAGRAKKRCEATNPPYCGSTSSVAT